MGKHMAETDLWRKVNQHSKEIHELKVQTSLNQQKIDQLDKAHTALIKDNNDKYSEVLAKLDNHYASITPALNDYHERVGAKKERFRHSVDFRWSVGILISVAMLIVAVYRMV